LCSARDELLTGTGLAGDQDRRVAIGDAADHLDRLADRRARARDAVDRHVAVGGAPQTLDLALQRQVLERAADGDGERVDLHRLGDEVVRAGADRGDRGVEAALARQHDGKQIRIPLPELLAEIDAGHARHLNVRDDDVGRVRTQVLEALLGRVDGVHIEAALAERIAQEHSGVVIVVDDKDGSVHSEVLPFYRLRVHLSDGPLVTLHTAGRRPAMRLTIARMSATKKMIFAIPAALAASPKKPKMAAISAMTKNARAQENISNSLGYASLSVQRICQSDADSSGGYVCVSSSEHVVKPCGGARCANQRARLRTFASFLLAQCVLKRVRFSTFS
jgi:hypothetical protein